MTEEQIKQNAEKFADRDYQPYGNATYPNYVLISRDSYIAGAHSRDEEIKEIKEMYHDMFCTLANKIEELRNPWISVKERLPEEYGNSGESVEVLGLFPDDYICKCKCMPLDNIWLIDENPIEINPLYWMPIPELNKG